MEFKDLVQLRRSHRKFTAEEIDAEDVKLILRAGLAALCLRLKVPKPLRKTGSPADTDFLTDSMKLSTMAATSFLSTPVAPATSLTISSFVITIWFNCKKIIDSRVEYTKKMLSASLYG